MRADARETAIGSFEAHEESMNRTLAADDSKIARAQHTQHPQPIVRGLGATCSFMSRLLKMHGGPPALWAPSIFDAIIQTCGYSHHHAFSSILLDAQIRYTYSR